MKKKLSIKARITLWYAALIMLICALALVLLQAISRQAQWDYCVSALESATVVILDEMEIEHGMVEIDTDIDEVPNVYASLFDPSGNLLYGRRRVEAPFEEGAVRAARGGGYSWMILDTLIQVPGYEPIWLRLHMSSDFAQGVEQATARRALWLLPLLSVLALLGGYQLTSGALLPVKRMTRVAAGIAGGGDLSGRIATDGYAGSRDELHLLADTLNSMLARLESSFEHERQFTSDAAHELRTPLTSMRTQGEYALSCERAEDKDEAIVQMLSKNEEMRRMIDQLLLIARMDAGQIDLSEDVDLAQMIARIAQDMEPVAQEKEIAIRTQTQAQHVCGSEAMLTRAVVNLVDNAIRYGHEGGTVTISLLEEQEDVVLRVDDDGAGMDSEALAHVFERFWRGDSARTTQGTGIGLAIVDAVARAHGGCAQVQSTPGAGSSFLLRLPKKN